MNQRQNKSGIALAGIIIGSIAVVLSAVPIINNFAFFLAAMSLILGIVGLVQVSKGKRDGRSRAVAAIILSVVAVVIVLASQSFYGSVIDDAGNKASKSFDKVTGNAAEELLKNDVDVTLGKFSATEDEFGLATTKLPVTITNKNAEKKSYDVKVEATGKSGNRIADDTVYVSDLGAGQKQTLKAFEYVESDKLEALKTAEFKIVSVSQM